VLLLLGFLYAFSFAGYDGILGLYVVTRFGYDPRQTGFLLMINGLLGGLTMAVLAGLAARHWGEVRDGPVRCCRLPRRSSFSPAQARAARLLLRAAVSARLLPFEAHGVVMGGYAIGDQLVYRWTSLSW
jgi:hypothetical protein